MKYTIALLTLLITVACGHSNTKEQSHAPKTYKSSAEIPVEEFFRNPALNGYRVSPDGKMLALLRPWKNRMNVFVHPIDNPKKAKQITFLEDRDINQIYWKGANHVLYHRDTGGDENYHVFAVNVKTGDVKDLTPFPKTRASLVDDLEESSATDVMIQHNHRNKEVFDLFRVNVETGASEMVGENKNQIMQWLIDHEGQVRGGTASDGVNSILYFEKTKGKGFEPVFKTGFRNQLSPLAFTADNQRLFVTSNLGRDLTGVFEIDPLKPIKLTGVKPIFAHDRYDVMGGVYSPVRKTLGNVQLITDRWEFHFLHPEDQKDWDQLKARFPGEGLLLANNSKDERFWVFKTLSDLSRGSYYVYDRKESKLTDLGPLSPWIQTELMSEMKTVNYKSRDGLTIQAYLTLPRGKDPKNLPVVINPHGGPWHRDQWGFNSEAQLLASRGYAVFQPNFRGSTGYGRKFWEASFKQWGKKMQDDVTRRPCNWW